MNSLVIAEISIRQDAEGRYCLNDLHRAAGGESRHQPGKWLENPQIQDLVAELEKTATAVIFAKQGLGTFVVKELVYGYAMWISPAFHLKVIRAYDASMTRIEPAELTREAILVMALESERERLRLAADNAVLEAELQAAQPAVRFHEEVSQADGEFAVRDICKALFNGTVKERDLRDWLRAHRWTNLDKMPSSWAMTQGYMRTRVETLPTGRAILVPVATAKGLALLRHLWREGELFEGTSAAALRLPGNRLAA